MIASIARNVSWDVAIYCLNNILPARISREGSISLFCISHVQQPAAAPVSTMTIPLSQVSDLRVGEVLVLLINEKCCLSLALALLDRSDLKCLVAFGFQ